MKSKLLNQILKEKELYNINCKDLNQLKEEYPSKTYTAEYIADIMKKAAAENENNRNNFINKINLLQSEYSTKYNNNISKELLNSNLSTYRNILEGTELMTDNELKSLCEKAHSEGDILSTRYLSNYIQSNNRQIETKVLVSSEEKAKAVQEVCDQVIRTATDKDKGLAWALLEKQFETKYDSILEG